MMAWTEHGFFIVRQFAARHTCDAMLLRTVEMARLAAAQQDISPAYITFEQQDDFANRSRPEERVSKIFRIARDPVFNDFALRRDVVDMVVELVGSNDVDCFLSQFIFKNAGAWGQPWHQDSLYFPFEPPRPVIGIWLAVTAATLDNGCLHVLPGSHTEPVHAHVPDRRPNANYGYLEIVDHDMSGSEPVLMDTGDLLVFDSHLMHCSTDNRSVGLRAAMVYHYAAAATVDHSVERFGYTINDWMAARRG
jgi:ectoine hydroxylase-related dioxygenase (phytanoyl-CoA dioxygenase family)